MYNCVVGNRILVFGDLHFSDVYAGKHKNYLQECCGILGEITRIISEKTPSAVVLLGDLIGWTETNIRDRQVLSMFLKVLKEWNEYCPVYAVKGNHDIKGYPDFLLFSELGLIITSDMCDGYFDYFGDESQEIPEVRFHLVDYKSEDKVLNFAENENTSNIVLAHNNFTINGVTTWYAEHDGIELGLQRNFSGVDMVISGHIHNPSPEIYAVSMPNGGSCMLFYPGCPTRPIKDKNIYESCWFVDIVFNNNQTDVNPEEFKLKPLDDIFYTDEEFVTEKTEEEINEELRKEALANILGDLLKYRMNAGDPIQQINNIPNGSPEAKKIAIQYLQTAFNIGT